MKHTLDYLLQLYPVYLYLRLFLTINGTMKLHHNKALQTFLTEAIVYIRSLDIYSCPSGIETMVEW